MHHFAAKKTDFALAIAKTWELMPQHELPWATLDNEPQRDRLDTSPEQQTQRRHEVAPIAAQTEQVCQHDIATRVEHEALPADIRNHIPAHDSSTP